MNRSNGFTLIELLVVIAIIAILAAIAFPVFSRAKDSAYRSSDMANMNSIRTALQLYRTDQGGFPPALLGYATSYMGGVPSANDVVPANQVVGALYPKRIDSLETLRPAYVRAESQDLRTEFARAVWPERLGPGGAGQSGQRFGPNDGWVQRAERSADGQSCQVVDNYYYRISGYDAGVVRSIDGPRNELRYALFWTGYTVPADPCNPLPNESGSAADDPRQLGYTDPPETTVVTWDSHFREYDGNVATNTKRDIVLFLGGSARMMSSRDVAQKSWAILP